MKIIIAFPKLMLLSAVNSHDYDLLLYKFGVDTATEGSRDDTVTVRYCAHYVDKQIDSESVAMLFTLHCFAIRQDT